jgi:hypothetical protein
MVAIIEHSHWTANFVVNQCEKLPRTFCICSAIADEGLVCETARVDLIKVKKCVAVKWRKHRHISRQNCCLSLLSRFLEATSALAATRQPSGEIACNKVTSFHTNIWNIFVETYLMCCGTGKTT